MSRPRGQNYNYDHYPHHPSHNHHHHHRNNNHGQYHHRYHQQYHHDKPLFESNNKPTAPYYSQPPTHPPFHSKHPLPPLPSFATPKNSLHQQQNYQPTIPTLPSTHVPASLPAASTLADSSTQESQRPQSTPWTEAMMEKWAQHYHPWCRQPFTLEALTSSSFAAPSLRYQQKLSEIADFLTNTFLHAHATNADPDPAFFFSQVLLKHWAWQSKKVYRYPTTCQAKVQLLPPVLNLDIVWLFWLLQNASTLQEGTAHAVSKPASVLATSGPSTASLPSSSGSAASLMSSPTKTPPAPSSLQQQTSAPQAQAQAQGACMLLTSPSPSFGSSTSLTASTSASSSSPSSGTRSTNVVADSLPSLNSTHTPSTALLVIRYLVRLLALHVEAMNMPVEVSMEDDENNDRDAQGPLGPAPSTHPSSYPSKKKKKKPSPSQAPATPHPSLKGNKKHTKQEHAGGAQAGQAAGFEAFRYAPLRAILLLFQVAKHVPRTFLKYLPDSRAAAVGSPPSAHAFASPSPQPLSASPPLHPTQFPAGTASKPPQVAAGPRIQEAFTYLFGDTPPVPLVLLFQCLLAEVRLVPLRDVLLCNVWVPTDVYSLLFAEFVATVGHRVEVLGSLLRLQVDLAVPSRLQAMVPLLLRHVPLVELTRTAYLSLLAAYFVLPAVHTHPRQLLDRLLQAYWSAEDWAALLLRLAEHHAPAVHAWFNHFFTPVCDVLLSCLPWTPSYRSAHELLLHLLRAPALASILLHELSSADSAVYRSLVNAVVLSAGSSARVQDNTPVASTTATHAPAMASSAHPAGVGTPSANSPNSIFVDVWQREWTTTLVDTPLLALLLALDFTHVPSLMDMQAAILQSQLQHRLRLKHQYSDLAGYAAFLLAVGRALLLRAPTAMPHLLALVLPHLVADPLLHDLLSPTVVSPALLHQFHATLHPCEPDAVAAFLASEPTLFLRLVETLCTLATRDVALPFLTFLARLPFPDRFPTPLLARLLHFCTHREQPVVDAVQRLLVHLTRHPPGDAFSTQFLLEFDALMREAANATAAALPPATDPRTSASAPAASTATADVDVQLEHLVGAFAAVAVALDAPCTPAFMDALFQRLPMLAYPFPNPHLLQLLNRLGTGASFCQAFATALARHLHAPAAIPVAHRDKAFFALYQMLPTPLHPDLILPVLGSVFYVSPSMHPHYLAMLKRLPTLHVPPHVFQQLVSSILVVVEQHSHRSLWWCCVESLIRSKLSVIPV